MASPTSARRARSAASSGGSAGMRIGSHAVDQRVVGEAALGEVLGRARRRCTPLAIRLARSCCDARRLGLLPRAELEPAGVLPAYGVVHGVAAQQQVDRGARAVHRVAQPDDRVVLLLDRRAIGAVDDVAVLSWRAPFSPGRDDERVGRLLVPCCQKSPGVPRRTPAIASPAPRSSTHSPQLTQSRLPPWRFGVVDQRARSRSLRQEVVLLLGRAAVHRVGMRAAGARTAASRRPRRRTP